MKKTTTKNADKVRFKTTHCRKEVPVEPSVRKGQSSRGKQRREKKGGTSSHEKKHKTKKSKKNKDKKRKGSSKGIEH